LWMAYDDIFRRWCLPPGTRNEPRSGSEKRLLVSGFTCVLVTNGCDEGELPSTSECVGCNIRTSRMVAKIFSEQLFAAVRSSEARLDRYLRNSGSPDRMLVF
jgi:hypothetical protein